MMSTENRIPWGLLDLAKHAPHQPAKWFIPVLSDRPIKPDSKYPRDFDDEEMPQEWRNYFECEKDWNEERNRQTDIQWPIAWAQGVLEGAEKLGLAEPTPPDPRIKLAEETLIKVLGFLGLNPGEKWHSLDRQTISQLVKDTINTLKVPNE